MLLKAVLAVTVSLLSVALAEPVTANGTRGSSINHVTMQEDGKQHGFDASLKARATSELPRKRELVFDHPTDAQAFSGKVYWAWNWDSTPGDGFDGALKFVPMLWGFGQDHVDKYIAEIGWNTEYSADAVMGFNEVSDSLRQFR